MLSLLAGLVLSPQNADAPAISPKELNESIRFLDSLAPKSPPDPPVGSNDALRLVRAANFLWTKGKAKAVVILEEFDQEKPRYQLTDHDWLFWLTRVLFRSNIPYGVFSQPMIGGFTPSSLTDLRLWPTFPVSLVDGVPLSFFQGASLRGYPESFSSYLNRNISDWTLRDFPLRPPDDPFEVYSKLAHSPASKWAAPTGDIDYFNSFLLADILSLVRDVYRPASTNVNGSDFAKDHAEFLSLGCHWNVRRQVYVIGKV